MNQEEYLLSDQESFEEEEQEINFGFGDFVQRFERQIEIEEEALPFCASPVVLKTSILYIF